MTIYLIFSVDVRDFICCMFDDPLNYYHALFILFPYDCSFKSQGLLRLTTLNSTLTAFLGT